MYRVEQVGTDGVRKWPWLVAYAAILTDKHGEDMTVAWFCARHDAEAFIKQHGA
jgi:hypothetical protein